MLVWSSEVVFTHCSHHIATDMCIYSITSEKLINKLFQMILSSLRDRLLFLEGRDVWAMMFLCAQKGLLLIFCANDKKSVHFLLKMHLGSWKCYSWLLWRDWKGHHQSGAYEWCVCLWVEGVTGAFLSRWLSGLVTVWVLSLNFGICGSVRSKEGLTCWTKQLLNNGQQHQEEGDRAHKHCSKRAKASCGRSRCAPWLDSHHPTIIFR